MKSNVINEGKHILDIIGRQKCDRHHAPVGIACFDIPRSKGNGYYSGICNRRAVAAGANGKISESSYQSNKRILRSKPAKGKIAA